ncbi:hypothetical protein TWF970_009758 [Orbilia oligospora]|uniref:Uncharacterized protein n=1 Tax=Orbilia oligospora TaxID=2813651 RepID=A0A7C8RM90_ORBOL|nr:hypothetical protein TWF970_009758 [Orbilia oligospora]
MDTYEIPAQAGTRTRKQTYYLKIAAQYEIQQDLARGKIGVKEAADLRTNASFSSHAVACCILSFMGLTDLLVNSISPSPSSLPAEYKTTVPATISKDNTNKETVLSGLLTTLASQQNQSSAGSDLGIISTPESPLPRRGQLQREDFGTPITEGYMSAPPSYKTKRHAGAALLSHKILKHTPTQPQSASDNIEYKLTAKNAASMERVERSQEEESTSALNDLCFGSPYPQSQLGIRISRTNRQATELNASVSDTNYTTPTCTMMTLDSVIFDPTQNKTESCLLGSPIPANGYTGIRIDPNCGYIETNAGTNSPARSLHLAAPIDELVEKVDVDSLRQKVRELERQVAELQEPEFSERQTLHRIFCSGGKPTVWLDHPRARNTRRKCQHYEANIPIPDERAYFKRNKHIHFVVYQDFQCCGDSMTGIKESGYESSVSSTSSDDDDDPRMAQHPFSIISREFAELISLLQVRANIRDWDRGFKLYEHIVGPHNCILRYIERIRATILTFNPRQQHLLNLLFDFIQDTFGDEFCQATKLFSHGYASADTICYLIGPEDVIVGKDNTHSLQAYIVRTWPQLDHNGKVTFKAWSWEFNGLFWKSEINIKLDLNNIFEDTYNV